MKPATGAQICCSAGEEETNIRSCSLSVLQQTMNVKKKLQNGECSVNNTSVAIAAAGGAHLSRVKDRRQHTKIKRMVKEYMQQEITFDEEDEHAKTDAAGTNNEAHMQGMSEESKQQTYRRSVNANDYSQLPCHRLAPVHSVSEMKAQRSNSAKSNKLNRRAARVRVAQNAILPLQNYDEEDDLCGLSGKGMESSSKWQAPSISPLEPLLNAAKMKYESR